MPIFTLVTFRKAKNKNCGCPQYVTTNRQTDMTARKIIRTCLITLTVYSCGQSKNFYDNSLYADYRFSNEAGNSTLTLYPDSSYSLRSITDIYSWRDSGTFNLKNNVIRLTSILSKGQDSGMMFFSNRVPQTARRFLLRSKNIFSLDKDNIDSTKSWTKQ
jgi:hypothetical protein